MTDVAYVVWGWGAAAVDTLMEVGAERIPSSEFSCECDVDVETTHVTTSGQKSPIRFHTFTASRETYSKIQRAKFSTTE
eukprot:6286952-Prymnesium_polylepis.2